MKNTTNVFLKGMTNDMHPLTTSQLEYTDALNATLITFNGNEQMMLNDMGNTRIQDTKTGNIMGLREGFIPVGLKEHGGIMYVASVNKDGKGEIGTIPSPVIKYDLNREEIRTDLGSWNISDKYEETDKQQLTTNTLSPGEKFAVSLDIDSLNIEKSIVTLTRNPNIPFKLQTIEYPLISNNLKLGLYKTKLYAKTSDLEFDISSLTELTYNYKIKNITDIDNSYWFYYNKNTSNPSKNLNFDLDEMLYLQLKNINSFLTYPNIPDGQLYFSLKPEEFLEIRLSINNSVGFSSPISQYYQSGSNNKYIIEFPELTYITNSAVHIDSFKVKVKNMKTGEYIMLKRWINASAEDSSLELEFKVCNDVSNQDILSCFRSKIKTNYKLTKNCNYGYTWYSGLDKSNTMTVTSSYMYKDLVLFYIDDLDTLNTWYTLEIEAYDEHFTDPIKTYNYNFNLYIIENNNTFGTLSISPITQSYNQFFDKSSTDFSINVSKLKQSDITILNYLPTDNYPCIAYPKISGKTIKLVDYTSDYLYKQYTPKYTIQSSREAFEPATNRHLYATMTNATSENGIMFRISFSNYGTAQSGSLYRYFKDNLDNLDLLKQNVKIFCKITSLNDITKEIEIFLFVEKLYEEHDNMSAYIYFYISDIYKDIINKLHTDYFYQKTISNESFDVFQSYVLKSYPLYDISLSNIEITGLNIFYKLTSSGCIKFEDEQGHIVLLYLLYNYEEFSQTEISQTCVQTKHKILANPVTINQGDYKIIPLYELKSNDMLFGFYEDQSKNRIPILSNIDIQNLLDNNLNLVEYTNTTSSIKDFYDSFKFGQTPLKNNIVLNSNNAYYIKVGFVPKSGSVQALREITFIFLSGNTIKISPNNNYKDNESAILFIPSGAGNETLTSITTVGSCEFYNIGIYKLDLTVDTINSTRVKDLLNSSNGTIIKSNQGDNGELNLYAVPQTIWTYSERSQECLGKYFTGSTKGFKAYLSNYLDLLPDPYIWSYESGNNTTELKLDNEEIIKVTYRKEVENEN